MGLSIDWVGRKNFLHLLVFSVWESGLNWGKKSKRKKKERVKKKKKRKNFIRMALGVHKISDSLND